MTKQCHAYADWQIENKKAEFMEWLYAVYERDQAPIGLRGTYTGLWKQFQQDLANVHRANLMHSALDKDTSIQSLISQ